MKDEKAVYQIGMYGAAVNIIGILLSGPLGMGLEVLIHPSPPWQSPAVWAENYHPIQILPYAGEFIMIASFLVMMVTVHCMAEEEEKKRTIIAVLLTGVFFGLIYMNNIAQTTYLPMLARQYNPRFDEFIFTLSLANPDSLAWAIELRGYALLGIATWIAAPVFKHSQVEKITSRIMVFYGVISVLGGLSASWEVGWVWDVPGLIFYMGWNIVVLTLACFFWLSMRQRLEALAA